MCTRPSNGAEPHSSLQLQVGPNMARVRERACASSKALSARKQNRTSQRVSLTRRYLELNAALASTSGPLPGLAISGSERVGGAACLVALAAEHHNLLRGHLIVRDYVRHFGLRCGDLLSEERDRIATDGIGASQRRSCQQASSGCARACCELSDLGLAHALTFWRSPESEVPFSASMGRTIFR